ncbi:hypothetical protein VTN02DRAFT_5972 [Thermoascus thermophilus]
MDDSDDDYFSDGFDDLAQSTLLQLEQNAFDTARAPSDGFTQREQQQQQQQHQPAQLRAATTDPSLYDANDYGQLDVGEPDAEVVDNGNGPIPAVGHRSAFARGFPYDGDHPMEDLRPPEQSAKGQTDGWYPAQAPPEPMETEEADGVEQPTEPDETEQLRARVEEVRSHGSSLDGSSADNTDSSRARTSR